MPFFFIYIFTLEFFCSHLPVDKAIFLLSKSGNMVSLRLARYDTFDQNWKISFEQFLFTYADLKLIYNTFEDRLAYN